MAGKAIFADSFYFIALLQERDAAHERALRFARLNRHVVVTTRWALAEVADALSSPAWRAEAGALVESLQTRMGFVVLAGSDALFTRGLQLYRRRVDKEWSLTDCISFVVMSDQGISEALTGDHHFEQAGVSALLK
jgi:predicted nucleic acid-binding protein